MKINKSTLLEFVGNVAFNLSVNPIYQFWGFVYGIASAAFLTGILVFSGSFIPYLWGKALYVVVIGFSVYMARAFYTDLKDSGSLSLK
jgi:hypothetical protein